MLLAPSVKGGHPPRTPRVARRPLVAIALVAALAIGGCIKADQTFTVYPDGSGKVHIQMTLAGQQAAMFKMALQMGQQQGGGAPGGADPLESTIKEALKIEGVVAWKDLKAEDAANGDYVISGIGYFDDINNIKAENAAHKFAKTATGFELEFASDPAGSQELAQMDQAQKQQMIGMMKAMMSGFQTKTTFIMPGTISSATGFKVQSSGRNAVQTVVAEDLFAVLEKNEKPEPVKVVSGLADPAIEAELAAFKAELAAAKAEAAKKEGAPPAGSPPAGGEPKPGTPEEPKPQEF